MRALLKNMLEYSPFALLIFMSLTPVLKAGKLCSLHEPESFIMKGNACFKHVKTAVDYAVASKHCPSMEGELADYNDIQKLSEELVKKQNKSGTQISIWTAQTQRDNATTCTSAALSRNTPTTSNTYKNTVDCRKKFQFLCRRKPVYISDTRERYWDARKTCKRNQLRIATFNTTEQWKRLNHFKQNAWNSQNLPTYYKIWLGLIWSNRELNWDLRNSTRVKILRKSDLPFQIKLPNRTETRKSFGALQLDNKKVFTTRDDRAYFICGTLLPIQEFTGIPGKSEEKSCCDPPNTTKRSQMPYIVGGIAAAMVVMGMATVAALLFVKKRRNDRNWKAIQEQTPEISRPRLQTSRQFQSQDSSPSQRRFARQISNSSYVSMQGLTSRTSSGYATIPEILPGATIAIRLKETQKIVGNPGISHREAFEALGRYEIPINFTIPGYMTFDPTRETQPRPATLQQFENPAFKPDGKVTTSTPKLSLAMSTPQGHNSVTMPRQQLRSLPLISEEDTPINQGQDLGWKHIYESIK